jgi:hypothetical protein
VFGVCEEEWFGTLEQSVIEEGLIYKDFIETAREMSKELRG